MVSIMLVIDLRDILCEFYHAFIFVKVHWIWNVQPDWADLSYISIITQSKVSLELLKGYHEFASWAFLCKCKIFKPWSESFREERMQVAIYVCWTTLATYEVEHRWAWFWGRLRRTGKFLPTPIWSSSNSKCGTTWVTIYVVISTVPPPQSQIRIFSFASVH